MLRMNYYRAPSLWSWFISAGTPLPVLQGTKKHGWNMVKKFQNPFKLLEAVCESAKVLQEALTLKFHVQAFGRSIDFRLDHWWNTVNHKSFSTRFQKYDTHEITDWFSLFAFSSVKWQKDEITDWILIEYAPMKKAAIFNDGAVSTKHVNTQMTLIALLICFSPFIFLSKIYPSS